MKKSEQPLHSRFSENATEIGLISVSRLTTGVEDWLAYCELEHHSPKTIELRRGLLDRLLRFLESKEYTGCGRVELRQFFATLVNERTGAAQRPSTVETYHRNISALFNWLIEEEIITESPMRRIPKPKVPRDQIQPLSEAQIQALLEAARRSYFGIRNQALVLFFLDTGVRASEGAGLPIQHLDLTNRTARIVGKGNKLRTVCFGKRTARALYRYLPDGVIDSTRAVFVAESGNTVHEPLTRSGVYQIVAELGKAAGIKGVRCSPHTLRHTFALSYLRSGGSLLALKLLLGHENLQMTNRYVALAEADLQNQHRHHSPMDRLGK